MAGERTDEDIKNLLSEGYIHIHPQLYDYVPTGSQIRYFVKGPEERATRFRIGGFVKGHVKKYGAGTFTIENIPYGKARDGYITYRVAYSEIDEMWKKYATASFIETHLIYSSLAQKKKQIDDLTARIKELELKLQ